jgi:FKBP-type peptidyl-prolyl cis-trans isomerase
VLLIFSCKSKTENPNQAKFDLQTKDALERINRTLLKEDREQIENYIKRNKLEGITESPTGLFYLIMGTSDGLAVKQGYLVEYSYKVSLLDGTLCYQSKADSLGKFVVGKGGVESGLEEGILLMKEGQKAKFIMPPHLAHGLIGDANRIPARAIIVYDIELLKVNP